MLTFSCTWRPPCSGPAYSDQISCRGARRKSVCVCSLVHQHATQWECWTTGSRPEMSRCEMSRAYHFYFTMPIYHYRIAGMYFLAQAYNKLSCATAFISFVLYITCWEKNDWNNENGCSGNKKQWRNLRAVWWLLNPATNRERERESRFLTAHQHKKQAM